MGQNDMVIANQAFAPFRADLNSALQALAGLSSGASEPSTKYAHQPWADTTNGFLKIRNAANSAWITLWDYTKQGILTQDCGSIFAEDAEASDAYVIALSPAITSYADGQLILFKANTANTGAATLNAGGGAKSIKRDFDDDLRTGDIEAGQLCAVIYHSTEDYFQLLNPCTALKIAVSSNDTTPADLATKIVGTANKITVTETNDGANETLVIAAGTHLFDKDTDDTDDITEGSNRFLSAGSVIYTDLSTTELTLNINSGDDVTLDLGNRKFLAGNPYRDSVSAWNANYSDIKMVVSNTTITATFDREPGATNTATFKWAYIDES